MKSFDWIFWMTYSIGLVIYNNSVFGNGVNEWPTNSVIMWVGFIIVAAIRMKD